MQFITIENEISFERIGMVIPKPHIYTGGQKDPSVVYDPKNSIFHMYFSNCTPGQYEIGHITSSSIEGPWNENPPIHLDNIPGDGVAAPAVEYINGQIVMFIQQEFDKPGGNIYRATSESGYVFNTERIVISSINNTEEAGIYDPSIHLIYNKLFILYTAFPYPFVTREGRIIKGIHGDIFLAESDNNSFSLIRDGPVIRHEDILFHNQHEDADREWGLEGADFCVLPDKSILMAGVCFLSKGKAGYRQRVFLAHSLNIKGPYSILGILSDPQNDWQSRENGHPCINIINNTIFLHLQVFTNDWKIGLIKIDAFDLLDYIKYAEYYKKEKVVADHI